MITRQAQKEFAEHADLYRMTEFVSLADDVAEAARDLQANPHNDGAQNYLTGLLMRYDSFVEDEITGADEEDDE